MRGPCRALRPSAIGMRIPAIGNEVRVAVTACRAGGAQEHTDSEFAAPREERRVTALRVRPWPPFRSKC